MVDSISSVSQTNVAELKSKLQEVKDKQGVLGNIWNGFKELTTLGTSYSDCKSMVEKYEDGEISMTDAMEYIESFETKQDNMVALEKNVLTGTVAIVGAAATAATGGTVLIGAGLGAAAKTALGFVDRATNNVEGDALDTKELAQDAISGAVTGATSALSSESFGNLTKGLTNNPIEQSMLRYGTCSATCGAISGATGYLTDVALDEDKDFNVGDFAISVASSSLTSAVVGAGLGAFQGSAVGEALSKSLENKGGEALKTSVYSATRKAGGRVFNDGKQAVSQALA